MLMWDQKNGRIILKIFRKPRLGFKIFIKFSQTVFFFYTKQLGLLNFEYFSEVSLTLLYAVHR